MSKLLYVEKQNWQRFPKVLIMHKKTSDGEIIMRYVKEQPERTCHMEQPIKTFLMFVCSECGARFALSADDEFGLRFCPNCGAKVVEQ